MKLFARNLFERERTWWQILISSLWTTSLLASYNLAVWRSIGGKRLLHIKFGAWPIGIWGEVFWQVFVYNLAMGKKISPVIIKTVTSIDRRHSSNFLLLQLVSIFIHLCHFIIKLSRKKKCMIYFVKYFFFCVQ